MASVLRKAKALAFVTGNANKLRETSAILGSDIATLTSLKIDLPELQGEPVDISKNKCRLASAQAGGLPVIVEDTSLCFDALQGLPGPYIKWFLDKLGHDGLNKMLAGFDDKSARALCVFSFSAGPGAEPVTFVGECKGKIVPPRGPADFGWDAVFEPEEQEDAARPLTFAEMSKEAKNKISHRYRALDQMKEWIKANPAVLLEDEVVAQE